MLPPEKDAAALHDAEAAVKRTAALLNRLAMTTVNLDGQEFTADSLQAGLGQLVEAYRGLDSVAGRLQNFAVEQQGTNPDLVMRTWLKATVDSNQKGLGRQQCFQNLGDQLESRALAAFPDASREFAAVERSAAPE